MSENEQPHGPEAGDPDRLGLGERIEQTVEQVGEAVERAEHRVEQAAEGVAEEVAEHVPEPLRAPVRWTVKRLVLVISLGVLLVLLLAMAGTAYYVWNHTEWAAHELTGRVNRELTRSSDVVLSVGGLKGNPLSSVEVLEPRVTFRGGGPVLLEARSMHLRYSTWALLAARRGVLVIELDHPVFHLTRDEHGALRLPTWKTEAPKIPVKTGAKRPFDFAIKITGGDVLLPEEERSIRDFDLVAGIVTGGLTQVDIRSLKWGKGPWGMALTGFAGGITVADSVKLEARELESPVLGLRGKASWARAGGPRQVEASVGHVSWSWLAKVFDNKTLDVPGEGRFDVRAEGEQAWRGTLKTHSTWDGLDLEAAGLFGWKDNRLTIESLAGHSLAGDLSDGRLVWSKQGWEIGGAATGADPAHWGVLGLDQWPAGKLQGRFRYVVDTRGRENNSWLVARLGPSNWTGWTADSAAVDIAFPAAAPDSFRVRAFRRGGEMTLDARTLATGWGGLYTLTRFPLDEWPDGRATGLQGTVASGSGTVEDRSGNLLVGGALSGTGTRWFGMETARWTMSEIKGRLLPTPDLDARLQLKDAMYLGIHWDSLATPCHVGDQRLAFTDVSAWAGDTLLTMSAGADWDRSGWRMVATRAEAKSGQFHWVAEPPVELHGDSLGVAFTRLEAADGDARLHVSGRWAQPGGSYDWQARAEGLRLDRLGLPTDLGLQGSADAALDVDGVAGDPRWTFHAHARQPGSQGHRADSLAIDLEGAPGRVAVKDFRLALGGGTMSATGRFDDTAAPWPDTLTAPGVIRWLSGASRWNGNARAEAMPLEPMSRLLGAKPSWIGRMDGTVDVGGRPARPTLRIALQAKPVSWKSLKVDEMRVDATYDGDRLQVTEFRTTRDHAISSVTGEMRVALALGRSPELLDAPMRWRVDLPNGDLALLPLIVPQLGYATGRFEVNAVVSGTPRKPEVAGSARVRDGLVRIAGREEVLENVRGDFSFSASRITLDSLSALQRTEEGVPGRVRARGTVDLTSAAEPTYAFDLSLRDFTAKEAGLYAARFDGDFRIVNGVKLGGQVLPHVTSDNVEIRDAVVSYDFAGQTEQQQVQASTQQLFWTYRIQVHANDKLRWRPPDGEIEFSADLALEQTAEKLVIFGDMDALRGTYFFLSNRFTVSSAKLTFDDVGGLDPLVDATAVTRLTPAGVRHNGAGVAASGGSLAGDDKPSPHVITVRISGRSSRPAVEFSDAPTDQNEATLDQAGILQELTVGRFQGGQKSGVGSLSDPLDSYLYRAISRQLSADLSRAFRGYINEWEIQRESRDAGGNLMINVGSQVNDKLAVRYGQRLPGTGNTTAPATGSAPTTLVERDIAAEYRINRFFYITSQLTQKRGVTGTTTTTGSAPYNFNVDLKARWEY